jgi:acyl transferase domain-containing protein
MSEARQSSTSVAIVGMAGRFPQARDLTAFWRNLCEGKDCISFFTDAELAAAGVPKVNSNYVKARGVLTDADLFDAEFFDLKPKEAEMLDPQHRVFLECAWEALEVAGYDSTRFNGAIGVFAGMSMNTYLANNLASHPELLAWGGDYQAMLANDKDFLPTRVSYKLNLTGPSLNIQTACSTSLVAVCVACQHLLNHQCDLALAGAVSIRFPQCQGHVHQEGGIGSADGHCRPFDAAASGTVAGEGVGIVVLKRLDEALRDGDEIYAVIKGFATNNDGSNKIGYTAPSVDGQAEVIAMAQAMAGVEPGDIGYVEAHGTATPLGDPIEIEALKRAFHTDTEAKNFCTIGSVKSNIGHLDVAAGVAGLIKTVLALQHGKIPASLHFQTPNPQIDFAASPFFVNATLRDWKRTNRPRRAGVSSFGIGGTNAHVILEEAPAVVATQESSEPQLLLLSAKTVSALKQMATNLAAHLRQHPELNLADIAHTLRVGRREFAQRRAIVCRDNPEAVRLLEAASESVGVGECESLDSQMLLNLARAWVAGEAVDWSQLSTTASRRRVQLPTYPFERKRYFIEPAQSRSREEVKLPKATQPSSLPVLRQSAPSEQDSTVTRKQRITTELTALLSELSGEDMAQVNGATFTELGFDSLFLTQVSLAIEKQFGVRVAFRDLLEEYPTMGALTTHLEAQQSVGLEESVAPTSENGNSVCQAGAVSNGSQIKTLPLTDAQRELWLASQISDTASCAYNESRLLHFRGALQITALQNALQSVVNRHEALRLTFSPDGDHQLIQPHGNVALVSMDLSSDAPTDQTAKLGAMELAEARTPFDLTNGPLLRARLVRFSATCCC